MDLENASGKTIQEALDEVDGEQFFNYVAEITKACLDLMEEKTLASFPDHEHKNTLQGNVMACATSGIVAIVIIRYLAKDLNNAKHILIRTNESIVDAINAYTQYGDKTSTH